MTATAAGRVRAAGGAIWRSGPAGIEVLVIHRERYNDWTLPKGKVHRGEHGIVGAVREVWEETGLRAAPGPRLPTVTYEVRVSGTWVEKVVDFWAMRPLSDDGFTATSEVDMRRWIPVAAALELMTYARDREVLAALVTLCPPWPAPVLLVRPAPAEPIGSNNDLERPLTRGGAQRAQALARMLVAFAPVRAISAPALRCQATLEPLASRLGIPVEIDASLGDDGDPATIAARLRGLAGGGAAVVSCSGRLISRTLAALRPGTDAWPTRKAGGWALTFDAPAGTLIDPLG